LVQLPSDKKRFGGADSPFLGLRPRSETLSQESIQPARRVATSSNVAVLQKYFQASTDKDRAAIEAVVDEMFRFSSPRDNRIDRATYFRRRWKVSAAIVGRKMIHMLADGDRVFVTYELAFTESRATRHYVTQRKDRRR
jgi:hypothetical protein